MDSMDDQHANFNNCNNIFFQRPLQHQQQQQDQEQHYHCKRQNCNEKFFTRKQLRDHEQSHKICRDCGRVFKTINQCEKHYNEEHVGFICPQCHHYDDDDDDNSSSESGSNKKLFSTEAHLKRHIATQHRLENKCDYCEMAFSNQKKKRLHIVE